MKIAEAHLKQGLHLVKNMKLQDAVCFCFIFQNFHVKTSTMQTHRKIHEEKLKKGQHYLLDILTELLPNYTNFFRVHINQ